MGPIEQFFSFLSTLYTPRRAALTVFMVVGVTLCLIFLNQSFVYWLTPALKPVTDFYLAYIAFLTATFGLGLSVLVFSLCEKLCGIVRNIWSEIEKKQQAIADKNIQKLKSEQAEAKFIANFKAAYPHLEDRLVKILEHLAIEGDQSFLRNAERIQFLNQQRWILAVAQVSKSEYLFKINELIKPYVQEKFLKEINFNVENAIASQEPAVRSILALLVSETPDKHCRIQYMDFYSVKSQEILKNCFVLYGYNRDVSLKFKDYYKPIFEKLMSKPLKESIEIEVFDGVGPIEKHNQVF
ncbi:hypothetical protein LH408_17700 [Enterobacter cloacae]|uniref:hypothetical protein n=1 Tax=Enterobacter cloacae TaxID=550 RepID=UPI001D016D13|nr:hypothetical protein [Enterobacter cloacae]UDF99879.1 hypothetical protein LH408_17700 [Enterobacter cloacae]